MPPPVEGLRAPLREPAGIRGEASRATGPGVSEVRTNAGRPPVPAQAGGEGVNSMKNNGLIISVTYDSNSYKVPHLYIIPFPSPLSGGVADLDGPVQPPGPPPDLFRPRRRAAGPDAGRRGTPGR